LAPQTERQRWGNGMLGIERTSGIATGIVGRAVVGRIQAQLKSIAHLIRSGEVDHRTGGMTRNKIDVGRPVLHRREGQLRSYVRHAVEVLIHIPVVKQTYHQGNLIAEGIMGPDTSILKRTTRE